jgi:hypothetical protein
MLASIGIGGIDAKRGGCVLSNFVARLRCTGGALGSLGARGFRPGFFGSLTALAAACSGLTSFFFRPGFLGAGAAVVVVGTANDGFGAEVLGTGVVVFVGATPENRWERASTTFCDGLNNPDVGGVRSGDPGGLLSDEFDKCEASSTPLLLGSMARTRRYYGRLIMQTDEENGEHEGVERL